MAQYDFKNVEKKWQDIWDKNKTFECTDDYSKKKFYALVEFPYPSGAGMHVGHIKAYSGLEVVSRKRRLEGYNVLFPIGFDAYGLPTENYAIKTGIHPRQVTDTNIAKFTSQLKRVGFSFDWSKVVDTTQEDYYKWTQWIFLKMFEKGLELKALYGYSKYLSDSFEQISNDYYSGRVSFTKKVNNLLSSAENEGVSFSETFTDIQQTMGDYPTLLYDGPFADAVINKKALGIGGDEITADEARKKAAEYLGCDGRGLKREADAEGTIELYCFSYGDRTAGITKKGGMLCYMTDPVYVGEVTISIEEAIKRGKEYLEDTGFSDNMRETYYSTYDGICTVNYAYEKDGITCYSDLVKVSVSLETGKAVALDSRGYLMNHRERESKNDLLSLKKCRKIISPFLSVISSRPAFVPLETGKEVLCYEFHCKSREGQEVLVYINAESGKEEFKKFKISKIISVCTIGFGA